MNVNMLVAYKKHTNMLYKCAVISMMLTVFCYGIKQTFTHINISDGVYTESCL